MPVNGGASNGPAPMVAQLPIRFDTIDFDVLGVKQTLELPADNLPGINVWLLQTGGPGVVTATIEFGNGTTSGIGGPTIWEPLIAPYVLVIGTPSLQNERLGSNLYRVSLSSTGVARVKYRLTASLT